MIPSMTKLFLASLAGFVLGYSHPLGGADDSYRAVAHSMTALVDTIAEADATFRDRYVQRLKGGNP